MRCPECGFVGPSVLPQCEKCGHRFRLAADSEAARPSSRPVRRAADAHWHSLSLTPRGDIENKEAFDSQDSGAPVARENALVSGSAAAVRCEASPAPADTTLVPRINLDPAATEERWRNELTRRVQKFRRRRANLRGSFETESTLEFDFDGGGGVEGSSSPGPALGQPAQPGEELDAVLRGDEELRKRLPALDSIPLHREAEALESRGPIAADPEADELQVETRRRRRLDPGAISIVMESSPADEAEPAPLEVPVAPLGQRFLAGVTDGLMLLIALAFFVAIVWWVVGGRLHMRLAHLGMLGFLVGFLVLSYFALFGRLGSATPGQKAAGLALRSLEGGAPTSAQAFWRAFGYLVSLSALMLGFVWALVDSESLTWHDRMSGTFLASRDEPVSGR